MRYSHVLGAAVVGLAAATAHAGMTVSLVPVNNTAGGFGTTTRTFDLKVTTTAGTKWASADLQFSLINVGSGTTSFFNLPTGDSNIVNLAGAGSTAYDTGVTSPIAGAGVSMLGKAQYPVESGTGSAVFPSTAAPGAAVDAAWGDTGAAGTIADGTYTFARFTVNGAGGADLKGRIGATNNSVAPVAFNIYLPILGDTDGDRSVGLADLDNVVNNLGGAGPLGDTNADGSVGLGDLDNVVNNLGNSLPGPGATLGSVVPEPASLSLLALGSLGLVARRRSH